MSRSESRNDERHAARHPIPILSHHILFTLFLLDPESHTMQGSETAQKQHTHTQNNMFFSRILKRPFVRLEHRNTAVAYIDE